MYYLHVNDYSGEIRWHILIDIEVYIQPFKIYGYKFGVKMHILLPMG